MSFSTTVTAIITRLTSETSVSFIDWTDLKNDSVTTFTPPTIDPQNPSTAIWIRPSVTSVPGAIPPMQGAGRTAAMALGISAPNYYEGLVVVQHFAPLGAGQTTDQALMGKAVETQGIFHRWRSGAIAFEDVYPPERIGRDESGQWYQINVTAPFGVVETLAVA